ncbi:hypothetical protein HY310_01250 [Candidatus Microgenomates bacterium]|nr:hypothetical protein [Candidatus Microgenomates bacterium]
MSTKLLTPENVLQGTKVINASHEPHSLEDCRRLVARGYQALSTKRLALEDVYADLCQDPYQPNGHALTVATLSPNHEGSVISGTARLVIGADRGDGVAPIESMGLLDLQGVWPHKVKGIPVGKTAEIGRLVIDKLFREPTEVKVGLTRQIYDALVAMAEQRGIEMIYAIMPQIVVDICREASIGMEQVPGFQLRETSENKHIFDTYDVYWGRLDPRLYVFKNSK